MNKSYKVKQKSGCKKLFLKVIILFFTKVEHVCVKSKKKKKVKFLKMFFLPCLTTGSNFLHGIYFWKNVFTAGLVIQKY